MAGHYRLALSLSGPATSWKRADCHSIRVLNGHLSHQSPIAAIVYLHYSNGAHTPSALVWSPFK